CLQSAAAACNGAATRPGLNTSSSAAGPIGAIRCRQLSIRSSQMNKRSRHGNHAAVAVVISTFVLANAGATDLPASVDAARLNRADRDAANWLSYGRTYSEQRFRDRKSTRLNSSHGSISYAVFCF